MLNVENSGKGNCMYYAYSISLMYCLRAKNDKKIIANVFNKLALSSQDQDKLRNLFKTNPHAAFSKDEIKNIIEPIVGPATRALGAKRTKEEFISTPIASNLFSSTQYGLEHCLKQLLQNNHPNLAGLINGEFTNPSFTDAEIYRTPGIKDALVLYAKTLPDEIALLFEKQWPNKEKEISAKKTPSEKDIIFYKRMVLDSIISEKVVIFFTDNNYVNLDKYIARLNQEFVWGTEDTLMTLHRAIRGDRLVYDKVTKRYSESCDNDIILHLHINGNNPLEQKAAPDIILNNKGNYHWTSKIPETMFTPKKAITMVQTLALVDDKKPVKPPKNAVIVQANLPKDKAQDKRQKHITTTIAKIDATLQSFSNKIQKLDKASHPKSYQTAQELFMHLCLARNEYVQQLNKKGSNHQKAALNFKEKCQTAVYDAQPVLDKDLSWGDYLKNLLKTLVNALIWTVSFGQVNSFFAYATPPLAKTTDMIEQDLVLADAKQMLIKA
ncbi:MAG: hypothetical protein PSV35_01015 [bacterium]|nr:hypothetical protein [bacterium]